MSEAVLRVDAVPVTAAGASDPGRVRQNNEDRYYFDIERGIFLVVDGVGGHAAGEVAASIAVDAIVDRLERGNGSPETLVREAITLANNEIYRRAQQSAELWGMTCVATVVLMSGDELTVGHVGDTRLYAVDAATIAKITRDHSPVGEQEDAREITELEAMRHPRRNEVFRDIGSALHACGDPDFIDIARFRFGPASAIVLCSDGLSDLVSSPAIERLVRRHAGQPTLVVDSLIAEANDAGGRDNVTVLYVEGPLFPAACRMASTGGIHAVNRETRAPGAGEVHRPELPDRPDPPIAAAATSGRARAAALSAARRIVWLLVGVAAGLLIPLLQTWVGLPPLLQTWVGLPTILGSRVLVVGGTATSAYPSIASAMSAATAGDVVQLEPGEYSEPVALKPGVRLAARMPGTAALVAPPGISDWTSVTAAGRGNVISGVRIVGRPDASVAIGVRLDGSALVLDDARLEGNIEVGVDVRNDGDIVIRSSRFSLTRGLAVRIGPAARPVIRQNVFVRGGSERGPAVHVQEEALPSLLDNVFVGYREPIGAPSARRPQLMRDNFLVPEPDDVGR